MRNFFGLFLFNIISICLCQFSFSNENNSKQSGKDTYAYKNVINKRVEGNQPSLWTPVSTIEDGAVYMIRSVENQNLYWDLTGGNLTNGTQVQLYELNYSQAQKFYFKRQFDVNGLPTYRLAPLFSYDKVLRLNSNSENEILQIADESYSDVHLYSDKLCFIPISGNPTQFHISTCFDDTLGGKLSVDSIQSGQKVKQKTNSSYMLHQHKWEVIKTDYMGLNVGNKTYINGLNEFRYVARVPSVGKYVIETRAYNNTTLDTYLRLVRDSDNIEVARNDDGGVGTNALITYNFSTIEEFSVLVRGYLSSTQGYCYVILRPYKTIYMTGTYDIDNQHVDRVNALNNSKEHIKNLGYFPIVYGNLKHETVFNDNDWEDKNKIDRDYYVFYGHGGNDGEYAVYFDGQNPDWTSYSELPNFIYADLIIWMICRGGNYDPANGYYHCMAYDSISNGANQSLGFKGEIYNLTADRFIPKLFEALKTNPLESAISIASQHAINSNWFWWTFYGQFHCDINNPILFTNDNRGGIQLSCESSDCEATRLNYINDNGFIRNKKATFSNTRFLFNSLESSINRLKNKWDEVLLFLCGNDNSPMPIAMCADEKDCVCKFFDLANGKELDPDMFEKIMEQNDYESNH